MASRPSSDDVPSAEGMPMLGLGTWRNTDPEECAHSVATALDVGYRHVDTAQGYDNEAYVGEGIERADVDREELFLATKVHTDNLAHDDVLDSTEESLERLGVDYLDLLYVHWPRGTYEAPDTLAAFDDLYDEGKIRHVGVSNFEPEHIDVAREVLDAPIFANQIECHPLLPQRRLREYCEQRGIEVVAYSPLAQGEVFEVDAIREIAEKHDVSAARVTLAWLREKGVTAIPKATGGDHVRDNWASLGLSLDVDDLSLIDDVQRRHRLVDPTPAPWD